MVEKIPYASRLPQGTVTYLFTDVVKSTPLWERHADAMSRALERHERIIRACVEQYGGVVFKTVGDEFNVAFGDACRALRAGVACHRALGAEDWAAFGKGFPPLVVRAALHAGTAQLRDGDYYGRVLNRTARVRSAAHGGQLLLSGAVRGVVLECLPEGVSLRDWGVHWLKGLDEPEHIYQVRCQDLADIDERPSTQGPAPRPAPEIPGFSRTDLERLIADIQQHGLAQSHTLNELRAIATHGPQDELGYWLSRVAEWSDPRFSVDRRFVHLSLLIDRGANEPTERWAAGDRRYGDLGDILEDTGHPVVVLLGAPGSGKSTLLRRLEYDLSVAAIRGEHDRVAFYVPLNTYASTGQDDASNRPWDWLAGQWSTRYPSLPTFEQLLAERRFTLLLDALNEMPHRSVEGCRERILCWKRFVQELARTHPGNRVVFSCRTLDYSAPLSTPELRVPQVVIDRLSKDQVRSFLGKYLPDRADELWGALEGSDRLELARTPYFLRLLVEEVHATGAVPLGRAELFTGYVRRALEREIERDAPLFQPGPLVDERDYLRVVHSRSGPTSSDLPAKGMLFPKLAALAHDIQASGMTPEPSQVRVDRDEAVRMLDSEHAGDIVAAGAELGVLDEDLQRDEVCFSHHLLQEYFAGRQVAESPDPSLAEREMRADSVTPSLQDVLRSLDPSEPLPPIESTGWEETFAFAAALTDDPDSFLLDVADVNVPLAGRCAAQPSTRARAREQTVDQLRHRLVDMSRSPAADLRARNEAGHALGVIGDPRYSAALGSEGEYIAPPLVEIAAGRYTIGWPEPLEHEGSRLDGHMPTHEVQLSAYAIGQFPVTRAEWDLFMKAGGYDNEEWWHGADAKAWRRGVGTSSGARDNVRFWRRRFAEHENLLGDVHAEGRISKERYETWLRRMSLDDDQFEAELADAIPDVLRNQPQYWDDDRFSNPVQPVVGICWHEARAFCAWLSAQLEHDVRLPSEAEWEAAARGLDGLAYACGNEFDPLRHGNTLETHIRATTPVGVFPEGDSPLGVSDMCGNVACWTSSLWGSDDDTPSFPYPYDPGDGRESAHATSDVCRVLRGAAWNGYRAYAHAALRFNDYPSNATYNLGVRVVADLR